MLGRCSHEFSWPLHFFYWSDALSTLLTSTRSKFIIRYHPSSTQKARKLVTAVSVLICLASAWSQTGPPVTGQWGPVLSWPFEVTHAHLLSNGKVLVWPPYNIGDSAQVWDPAAGIFTPAPKAGYNIFCTGHSHLADGRLFVSGGQIGTVLYGVPNASIYDPVTASWSRVPDMYAPRWYPTNTTLANGDVLVTSGQTDPARGIVALPQIWQAASGTWQDLSSAQLILPLYPRMFLAPNGKVFNAGDSPQSRYLDTTGTGRWTLVASAMSIFRDYGSAVQYGDGKILIMGGGRPPTATAEVIDLTAATPAWRQVGSMMSPRRQLNATLLPNGQVLVTGGTSGPGFNDKTHPVLAAEVWDPLSETWTALASQSGYRGYHSIALLLPDATVLIAGGDANQATAQVFSPPYLFNGPRPTISSAPSSVNYGETFFVGTADAPSIARITWLKLGSVTHAFNQDQRFNNLGFTIVNSGPPGLKVTVPADPNLAPPGDYMMFVLNTSGVPSVASFVRLNPATGTPPPVSLAPSSVFMPNAVIGTPSSSKNVLLINNQTVALGITTITASGDFSETDNCATPISPGGSCTLTVTFTPAALGIRSGTIGITDSASNSPQLLNLSGNGVAAASTSVNSRAFGTLAVGSTKSLSLFLFNNQAVPLHITGISTSGDYAQTNQCISPLGASQYCSITVNFTPTSTGSRPGVLTITDDANNSPQTVSLSGSGK